MADEKVAARDRRRDARRRSSSSPAAWSTSSSDGHQHASRPAPVVAASVSATIASALPGFLVGALAVQMRSEFGVSESIYAWAMSAYFLAATLGSIPLGRVAQRVGPRLQVAVALGCGAAANLAIAAAADSFGVLVGVMAVIGFCNAAAQTAVNLALASADLPGSASPSASSNRACRSHRCSADSRSRRSP